MVNNEEVQFVALLVRPLQAALEREYPEARILEIASRDGLGVEALFDILSTETGKTRQVREVDYERYAVGEALLGWVNIQGNLEAGARTNGIAPQKKEKGQKRSVDFQSAPVPRLLKLTIALLRMPMHG